LRRRVTDLLADSGLTSGDLPAERRERHLDEHTTFFRHPLLREWSSRQQRRFRPLLAMPAPQAADMCSECQAPADWLTYALSLRLWPGTPEPGSTAAKLAALLPGWRERCPACTDYQIRHQWGGTGALPGFDAAQWQAMLTPVLRAIFAPAPTTPRNLSDATVSRVAQRVGRTPAQVLLRWSIQRGLPVITKSTHRERIHENAQIFDFTLSEPDMAELDALDQTNGTDRALERKWW
jgi:hypothetical protein